MREISPRSEKRFVHACVCVWEGVREQGVSARKRARREKASGRGQTRGAREARSGRESGSERERGTERDEESTKLETHYARSAPAVRRSGGQSDTAGS